ncbi:MAG: EAL domain-containing protein [Granulosicoccaceae bacterium]
MPKHNLRDTELRGRLTVLFDGSDEERVRIETLAERISTPVLFRFAPLGEIFVQDVGLNDTDIVIVSLNDGTRLQERLDTIEILKLQTPIVVMCAQNHHLRALEGIRRGASDWLVDGIADEDAFGDLLDRVLSMFAQRMQIQNNIRLYQSVADDQFDLICRFRPDGALTFVNRAYAEFFNCQVEELQGKSFLLNVLKTEHQRVLGQLAALTPNAPSSSFDHPENVDGHVRWYQWTDSAVFDADGKVIEYQSIATDITVRRNAEQAATDNEARYRALYENAPVMMHVIDNDGLLQSVNRCWLDLLDYTEPDVLGKRSTSFLSEESQQVAAVKIKRISQGEEVRNAALQFRHREGKLLDVLVTATAIRDAVGEIYGIVMIGVEVTERIQARRELEKEKERLRITLASIGDAVITTDHNDMVDYLNPAAESLTGWSGAKAYGHRLGEVFDPQDAYSHLPKPADLLDYTLTADPISARLFHRHRQEEAIVEFTIAPIKSADGGSLGRVLVFRDTTEAKALADRLSYQASHDPLTGLLNRRAFEEQLQQGLETNAEGTAHVLCFLDLDRFKLVNDSCGHEAGDRVLCNITELMQSRLRQHDTLSRLGGDEFAVLFHRCAEETARELADAIRADVAAYRFSSQEHVFSFGVSIGMVVLRNDFTVSSALRAADSACYTAKAAGRNRVHFSRDEDVTSSREGDDSIWAQRVTDALDEGRFVLLAQPIERGVSGADSGACFEVLVRMLDEDDSLIPPNLFIPAAERFGLMSRLDRWVIEHVFDWLVAHHADLDNLDHCAINLSGRSLDEPGFLAFVEAALDSTGVPPNKVCFEVTETAAISSLDAALQFMLILKKRGCLFSLDDFGSGLSSFAYLRSLPVDYLKIDGVFVRDILDDETDLAMVRAINEIGHVLGKQTVAEYVENDSIRAVLVELGVDWVQGYGVGKPIPLEVHWEEAVSPGSSDGQLKPPKAA